MRPLIQQAHAGRQGFLRDLGKIVFAIRSWAAGDFLDPSDELRRQFYTLVILT